MMSMSALAFGLYVLFLAVGFGLRALVHRRRTGSSGFRGISGRPGSAEWTGGVLFIAAVVVGMFAPVLQMFDVLAPLPLPVAVNIAGAVIAVVGIVATVAAQEAMGASWRVGVDNGEKTGLVTDGLFAVARNPVFTAVIAVAVGLTVLAPNIAALAALALLVVAVELQVRFVEEPYLLRTHGREYLTYAQRVGRFLPYLGRLTDSR